MLAVSLSEITLHIQNPWQRPAGTVRSKFIVSPGRHVERGLYHECFLRTWSRTQSSPEPTTTERTKTGANETGACWHYQPLVSARRDERIHSSFFARIRYPFLTVPLTTHIIFRPCAFPSRGSARAPLPLPFTPASLPLTHLHRPLHNQLLLPRRRLPPPVAADGVALLQAHLQSCSPLHAPFQTPPLAR